MADETSPQPRSDRQFVWLAVVAMACLLLLALAALATAFLLGRNQPLIAINNGSNNQSPPPELHSAAAPAPAVATSVPAPFNRAALSSLPVPQAGAVNRAAAPVPDVSAAYYATLSPVAKVQFRVRALPNGPTNMKGPVPFRVRQYQPAADGRVPAVFAEKPAPALAGQKDADAAYSFMPDALFSPTASKGKGFSVNVVAPRKSSLVNGLRAPKGFQFFVAELLVNNFSDQPLSLDPDAFEVRDSDAVGYPGAPELLGAAFPRKPLPGGGKANFQVAFLVPADATLVSLVTAEPGGTEQVSPFHPL